MITSKKIQKQSPNDFPVNFKGLIEKENILYVNPSENEATQKIFLTKSKSAWITIEWLSDELKEYACNNYQAMFDLRPSEKGKVVLRGEEIHSPRWHRSYLNTPLLDSENEGSYMYAGKDFYKDLSLPPAFQVFLDFLNGTEQKDKYNQVIANWYINGNDFIAAHSDCEKGMKSNAGISIITLNEDVNHFRELRFLPKKLKETENDNIYNYVKIAAVDGSIITMHGDTQQKFRHKIPKALDVNSSRISLTFRKF